MTREMYSLQNAPNSHTNIILGNWDSSLIDIKIRSGEEFFLILQSIRLYREQMGWDLNCTFHLFMDEVGSIFNSREFKNLGGDEIGFLTQLRKTGVFLYYGVQHPAFVDITFRRITEEIRMCSPYLELGELNMSGRRQPWGFQVRYMTFDEENLEKPELIEKDKQFFALKKQYTAFFTTTECIEDRFDVPDSRSFKETYHKIFTAKVEDILRKKEQNIFSKIFSYFYLPNPFWKM